jgi:hypothetical protein
MLIRLIAWAHLEGDLHEVCRGCGRLRHRHAGYRLPLGKLEGLSVALDEKDGEMMRVQAAFFNEAVQTLRNVAGRLDHRLRDLEPLLAERLGESVPYASSLERRAT